MSTKRTGGGYTPYDSQTTAKIAGALLQGRAAQIEADFRLITRLRAEGNLPKGELTGAVIRRLRVQFG